MDINARSPAGRPPSKRTRLERRRYSIRRKLGSTHRYLVPLDEHGRSRSWESNRDDEGLDGLHDGKPSCLSAASGHLGPSLLRKAGELLGDHHPRSDDSPGANGSASSTTSVSGQTTTPGDAGASTTVLDGEYAAQMRAWVTKYLLGMDTSAMKVTDPLNASSSEVTATKDFASRLHTAISELKVMTSTP